MVVELFGTMMLLTAKKLTVLSSRLAFGIAGDGAKVAEVRRAGLACLLPRVNAGRRPLVIPSLIELECQLMLRTVEQRRHAVEILAAGCRRHDRERLAGDRVDPVLAG